MRWLAATNLCPESRGVLELVAWLGTHAEASADDDFRAVCVATDRDFFGVTDATRTQVGDRLDVYKRQEDTRFVWRVDPPRLVEMLRPDFHVAMLHGSNTASKPMRSSRWKRRPYHQVRDLMGEDWASYVPVRS